MGGPPDHRLVIPEGTKGKLMTKCEQITDLGITMNSAFTPLGNILIAANKARGIMYEGNFRTSI